VDQLELSVLRPEPLDDGTLDQAQRLGMKVMAWSPLGGGQLFLGADARARRVLPALETIADARQSTPDAVALAWLMALRAGVHPVLGSSEPKRLRNMAKPPQLRLVRQDWFQILEAIRGAPVP
jgi:predicted oxidoreductase